MATVVALTHDLPAGELLTAADLRLLRVPSSAALASAIGDAGDAVGRRTRLGLPAGTLLSTALLAADVALPVGHRQVRVPVDAGALPPALQVGDVVDVLAAIPDSGAGGRVVVVCTGSVLAVGVSGGGSADAGAGPSPTPGSAAVSLDVDAAGAARLLWAESFAKALHLLVRSAGDTTPPPDVAGLAP